MQATLIWNDKWTQVILRIELVSVEIRPYCTRCVLSFHHLSSYTQQGIYTRTALSLVCTPTYCIYKYICWTYPMYLPCADCMNSSLPLRRCGAKIWLRRVNANVLTSLLVREFALLTPLNFNLLFNSANLYLCFICRRKRFLVVFAQATKHLQPGESGVVRYNVYYVHRDFVNCYWLQRSRF